MMWVFAILIVLAMGGIAAVASGRGRGLAPAHDDRPDALVPAEGPLGSTDLRRVRFSLALRGYRMSEVDALLDRLADQLAHQHTEQDPAPAVPARDVDAGFELDDAVGDAGWRPAPDGERRTGDV
ncbi:DivIVA domain-containing protein [Nocardioides nanhaiensis]|uniref:DivIVA domain-containing protein n=1 Tax=Nocardioides nanhaiensis TaxID=1476871 RepID=A0ABP8X3K0_9ACTN